MHNRPLETVTEDASELIKMQPALGFSSKIESVLQNMICGPFIYRAALIEASGYKPA